MRPSVQKSEFNSLKNHSKNSGNSLKTSHFFETSFGSVSTSSTRAVRTASTTGRVFEGFVFFE